MKFGNFAWRRVGALLEFWLLIEPWNAEDETSAVLLSNLLSGSEEEEFGWSSQILCSTVLPKFLALEKSASRVVISATVEFCKIHQRAAEYALVFPLILRKEGINNFRCEVISTVLKDCWHLGHISAFCHKLLCGRTEERRFLFLPCHRDLISDDLTWNESLFILFQNILIHDVPLTQGSVDCLAFKVQELAESSSIRGCSLVYTFLLRRHKHSSARGCTTEQDVVLKGLIRFYEGVNKEPLRYKLKI